MVFELGQKQANEQHGLVGTRLAEDHQAARGNALEDLADVIPFAERDSGQNATTSKARNPVSAGGGTHRRSERYVLPGDC
ncbi:MULTISPECIES: hypothetical protein [unclassified Streptomyces]|uniref:hypothetical protein n=1 Tax=unclassified Streptomyces TaxID=2593676 RepID=UPI00224CBDBD|nr:hypothetical protein [Streptomyces sp. NBC_00047]MCX5612697.1 hypothetical protein [Streptomyces sp. NBC_00047]